MPKFGADPIEVKVADKLGTVPVAPLPTNTKLDSVKPLTPVDMLNIPLPALPVVVPVAASKVAIHFRVSGAGQYSTPNEPPVVWLALPAVKLVCSEVLFVLEVEIGRKPWTTPKTLLV